VDSRGKFLGLFRAVCGDGSHPKRIRERLRLGWERRPSSSRAWAVAAAGALCLFLLASLARAQESEPDQDSSTIQVVSPDEAAAQQQAPATLDRTPASVHGTVRNGATGEPLARALVRIEGDANSGALTDSEGRFEIPGIPVGPQAISVEKPGFRDRPAGASEASHGESVGPAHSVMVAASMPDLEFTLDPTSVIRGQVELSTGEAGDGIGLTLLRRAVSDGRGIWQTAGETKTRSDGSFRFAGLSDGAYALYTEPSIEGDLDTTPGSVDPDRHWGYASVFYPDARTPTGAVQITLKSGQETDVTLTLAREAFQTVTAALDLPQGMQAAALSASIMDSEGHQLPYRAQYNSAANTVQAVLPDGSYSMLVTTVSQAVGASSVEQFDNGPPSTALAGTANFTVAARALSSVRIKLGVPQPSPVALNVERSGAPGQTEESTQKGDILVTVSPADGWVDNGIVAAYARGSLPGPLEAQYTPPGSYWAHLRIAQKGYCEASLSAGGANLAREPVTIGLNGPQSLMQLTLRDDCAALTLALPENLTGMAAGEENSYTVWAVPDFDFASDLEPVTLRTSTGGSATLEDLTPGNYHVYAFAGPMTLEYHSREALAALTTPGQAITLSPGATATLVLEMPKP